MNQLNDIKHLRINSLWLKILAVIFMTLDHIGYFLMTYAPTTDVIGSPEFWAEPMNATGYIFRIIGRFALPLFCILLVDGLNYTKSRSKYLARLGIMMISILLVQAVLNITGIYSQGNIFIDLFVAASFITLVELKNNYKWFALVPMSYIIINTIVVFYESYNSISIDWLPMYLRSDYHIYSFLMLLACYYCVPLIKIYIRKYLIQIGLTFDEYKTTSHYRSLLNIFWSLAIFLVTGIIYILAYVDPRLDIYTMAVQSYALLSIVFVLLYNGVKGYTNKVIQYSFYIYYPLHLVVIYLIFFIIFGY